MLFFISSVLGVFVIFGNVLSIKSHLAHFQVILIHLLFSRPMVFASCQLVDLC